MSSGKGSGVPVLLRAWSCGCVGWECIEMRGCSTAAPGPGAGSQGKGRFPPLLHARGEQGLESKQRERGKYLG